MVEIVVFSDISFKMAHAYSKNDMGVAEGPAGRQIPDQ